MMVIVFTGSRWSITLLIAWLLSTAALADSSELEPATVAAMAATCQGCHSRAPTSESVDQPSVRLPRLTGQSADMLSKKLLAYRADTLQGTLMNRLAKGYSEAQLTAIAAFLSQSP